MREQSVSSLQGHVKDYREAWESIQYLGTLFIMKETPANTGRSFTVLADNTR